MNFLQRYSREIYAGLSTFFGSTILIACTALRYSNDDQFILYRYVDNLFRGHGFVYNIGEKVLGSTTPLFTIVSTFAKLMMPQVSTPNIIAVVNILCLSIAGVFFYRVARLFLSERFSFITLAVFVLNLSRTIPEGMETPLFLMTLFIFLDCLLRKKYYISSVFLSLTILTRPDAGLIAVLVVLYWWHLVGWKKTIRLSVVSIAVALPWLMFATLYFGSFVPQSLITKLHSADTVNMPQFQAAKVQLSSISRIYWGRIFDPENIPLQTLFNLLPFLGFVAVALWKKITKENWIIFAIPFAYFLSFSLSNPVMFPWYISEMEPLWILISMMGIAFLVEKVRSNVVQILLCAIILAGPLFLWTQITTSRDPGSKITLFEMGQYIKEHQKPGDTVGLSNIGIVGYITDAYIVDFIGLVRNDSVQYYPIPGGCVDRNELYVIPPRLVQESLPTWLVAGEGEVKSCLLQEKWFAKYYAVDYTVGAGGAHIWKLRKNL